VGSIPERGSICVRQLYQFLYSLVCGVFLVPLPFGARVGIKTLKTFNFNWSVLQNAAGINSGAEG
jgi:hypothetical protein